jgi:hypothetical protein
MATATFTAARAIVIVNVSAILARVNGWFIWLTTMVTMLIARTESMRQHAETISSVWVVI